MSATKCGTYAGWNAHRVAGEDACPDCKEAQRLYIREWRRTKGVGRAYTFPTVIGPKVANLDGLGVSIARALRESA